MDLSSLALVMTTYNSSQTIARALKSLEYSLNNNINLIIIDDNSDDNTLEIINQYKELKKFSNLKYFKNDENMGAGYSKNRGIGLSDSKYVCFMDSDDWIKYDYYEKLLINITSYNSDIIRCGGVKVVDLKREIFLPPLHKYYIDISPDEYIGEENHQSMVDYPWLQFGIYKKDFIDKYNIYCDVTRSAEDRIFQWQVILNNPKLIIIPYYYYFYDKSYNYKSLTQTLELYRFDFLLTYPKIISLLRKYDNEIYLNKAVRQLIALIDYHEQFVELLDDDKKNEYSTRAHEALKTLNTNEISHAISMGNKNRQSLINKYMQGDI